VALDAQVALHDACGRGGQHIRTERADDDQVNVLGGQARILNSTLRGERGEHGNRFVGCGNAALPHARALNDPFVGRFDHLFEVGIGKTTLGERTTSTGNHSTKAGG
jgi:hypothetical protein